ncbi:hypothetical protein M8C21_005786, partial [Ambrosia artemisiifolia]
RPQFQQFDWQDTIIFYITSKSKCGAHNDLTGPMPRWVRSSTKNVDLSYNHFTWDASAPENCEQGTM